MTAALAEPVDMITKTAPVRTPAPRGRGQPGQRPALRGPVTPEGKERSRRNGCKDGLTGKGIVLPPDAAAEVDRREAAFAGDFRPRNAVERDLVRQMALGSWRRDALSIRIDQHDARMNAARFANWVEDQRLAAAGLGRRLADDPERTVIRLPPHLGRLRVAERPLALLGNGLATAEEGGPGCTWTDADLALALDLLGLPAGLRHLDDRTHLLESLRAEARSGSEGAVAELRELIAGVVAELEERDEEAWTDIERPRLEGWRGGGDRPGARGGAAAPLRDGGRPAVPVGLDEAGAAAEGARPAADPASREHGRPRARPAASRAAAPRGGSPGTPAPAAVRPLTEALRSSLLGDPASPVLDFWAAGRPGPGVSPDDRSQDKTNPAPGRPANGATPPKAGFPPAAGPGNRP